MAFSPDMKTISRNVYLQRKLSVQCEFLDKEKLHLKKQYEEKQRDCQNMLKRLQNYSKRYGVPISPVSVRPHTCSTYGARSRSQSLSAGSTVESIPDRRFRLRSSSQGQSDTKNEYVKDMKVYAFERLACDNPDTEVFTVYCHNPTRKVSSGTPVSKMTNLVPTAFVNYNSEIKWNEVRTISRSEHRNTLVDMRTPIILADVGRMTQPNVKQRSMSYSGPPCGSQHVQSEPHMRQRSSTISGPYRPLRHKHMKGPRSAQEEAPSNSPSQDSSHGTQAVHGTASNPPAIPVIDTMAAPPGDPGDADLNEPANPAKTEKAAVLTQTLEIPDTGPNSHTGANLQQSYGRNALSPTKSIRRLSAPAIRPNLDVSRIARSSHEARMQRRLSQGRRPSYWIPEQTESGNDSEIDEDDPTSYDVNDCVAREVSAFLSTLKCSDAMEDRVKTYMSSARSPGSSGGTTTGRSADENDALPTVKVCNRGKQDADGVCKKAVPSTKKTPSKLLTQKKLAGLLKRPQMQLQLLLHKIRDANKAAERADRMKPKTKVKCTF